ncbi:MAG: murein biosynthesis integral membrane protein MurJ [Phycisphaerales bacterium]|nr:MAG: murein biosynthesis integral membrane protein MurJ [Phycisphaerales bacterium]
MNLLRLPIWFWRAGFLTYALILVFLTHIPGVSIPGPVPRPDLFVHIAAFGLWNALAIRCGWFGRWGSLRNVALTSLLAAAWSGLDEYTQQFFGRVTAWDDFFANLLGVGTGAAIGVVWAKVSGWLDDKLGGSGPFEPQEDARARTPQGEKAMGSGVRTVSGLTLVSRVAGLGRDLVTVRVFGDTMVGSAFAAAFAIPNLFRRLFGEGALSAAFLPEYVKLDKEDPDRRDGLAVGVLFVLLLVTGALTVVIELALAAVLILSPPDEARDLSLRLVMLMLPFMPMVCCAAILGAMLQSHGRFAPAAAAPILLNGCIIGAASVHFFTPIVNLEMDPKVTAHLVALAALVAGIAQVGWCVEALGGVSRFRRKIGDLGGSGRRVFKAFIPMVIGLGTIQLNALVDTLIAMWPVWVGPTIGGYDYPLDERSNAILTYTQRLYQFPLGVFGIAVATVAFPMLSRAASDPNAFVRTLKSAARLSLFIALPASVGLVLVRGDLTGVVFGGGEHAFSDDGLARSSAVLLGYAVAVWAYSLNHVFVRAFYAHGDTMTPLKVAVGVLGLNLALNLVLIWFLREAGLAWSTAICAILQTCVLAVLVRRFTPADDPRGGADARGVSKILLTTLVMGAGVGALLWLWPEPATWVGTLLRLGAACALGGVLYGAAAFAMRLDELKTLLGQSDRRRDEYTVQ